MTSPLKVSLFYKKIYKNQKFTQKNHTKSYVQVKVVLLGEAGVGKTCLVQRFINDVFADVRIFQSIHTHSNLHITHILTLIQMITHTYATLKPQESMSTIGVSFLQRTVETDSGTSVKYVISPTPSPLSITYTQTQHKTQVGNMGYRRSGNVQIDLTSLLQSSRSRVADVRSDTKINL